MSKVLYIKANPKSNDESNTFKLSEEFITAYRHYHPGDEITTLDLYKEGIHPLDKGELNAIFGEKTSESVNHPVLKYAYQFVSFDKYVFSAPMWNLSIPSILKAYIDYICVAGITFRYTEEGPVGICKNKKAAHITTRGGVYSEGAFAPYEMGDKYLRTILGFLGIENIVTISAEKLNIVGEDYESIMRKAIAKARDEAKNF